MRPAGGRLTILLYLKHDTKYMEILLQTDNTMLIDKDGRLEMLPINDYTKLRFGRFGGGRIHHDFGDGCVIQETYNRGIYNCECDGELMQVYDGGRPARAVLDGDADAYRDIFSEMYSEKMEAAVVDTALAGYGDRVRRDTVDGKAAYVVDETWAVGEHGGAMYRQKDGGWHHLCLVADPTGARSDGHKVCTN